MDEKETVIEIEINVVECVLVSYLIHKIFNFK